MNKTKILIDPHDGADTIDMGKVKADFTLISSTWHDHGHIGASPHSIILSEAKNYKLPNNIIVSGIETKENRGTPNIIYNIKWKKFSLTNFADLGDFNYQKKVSNCKKKTLASTNIAFCRAGIVDGAKMSLMKLALKSCDPTILIPHHYYPASFANQQKGQLKKNMLKVVDNINFVTDQTGFPKEYIKGHSLNLSLDDMKDKRVLMIEKLHPQVKHT